MKTASVPMAQAVTTTFVCSEPEDGLAPNSDHMSISPLFFGQAPSWQQPKLISWLSFKKIKTNSHSFEVACRVRVVRQNYTQCDTFEIKWK